MTRALNPFALVAVLCILAAGGLPVMAQTPLPGGMAPTEAESGLSGLPGAPGEPEPVGPSGLLGGLVQQLDPAVVVVLGSILVLLIVVAIAVLSRSGQRQATS